MATAIKAGWLWDGTGAPPVLDGVVAVPRQRGDDVQLVAKRRQLVNDAGDHLTGRRGVRLEVRAQHRQAQWAVGAHARSSAVA